MRIARVLLSLLICMSLVACSYQESVPTDDRTGTSEGNTELNVDNTALKNALGMVSQGNLPHIFDTLVRVLLEENNEEDLSQFKVLYFTSCHCDAWGNLWPVNEAGQLQALTEETANQAPILLVIEEPSGALTLKIGFSNGLSEDWTWLFNYLRSVDIAEFKDENGPVLSADSGLAFEQSQQYIDFCRNNYQEEYFNRIAQVDPERAEAFFSQDAESQLLAWQEICIALGNNIVPARMTLELNETQGEHIDAVNLLLENGYTKIGN